MRAAACLALALVALAGCQSPPPAGTGPATTTQAVAPPASDFDGEAALEWVKALALRPDGSARYRIPGTEGQLEGARALWNATALPGWTRSWQNFTGEDYLGLDRSAVAGYTPGTGVRRAACSEEEEAKVPGLRFANLLAVRPGLRADAPLLLLGAHWDSQMESDNDPDPAKRGLPDPGANDGASGVGVLLQLMRELEGRPLPFSVGLFLIDGEDGFYSCYPLAGSLWFAQKSSVRPAAFVLLDMVGDPGARYPKESHSRASAPALQELLWRHGQARPGGAAHFTNQSAAISDDHLALIQAGVPCVDIIDAGRPATFPPQWNTAGDTVDKLSAAMLGLVGQVLLDALADPGLAAAVPGLAG